MNPKPRALVLLDRDGCLIEERHYLGDPAGVALLPRAARAVRLLEAEGIARAVCTNQAGVAKGYFGVEAIGAVHEQLTALLAGEGATLDAIKFCTAHEDADDAALREGLERRKPRPGMALEVIAELGLAGVPVFGIGDKLSDAEFARNAGGVGILVRTGYGAESEAAMRTRGDNAPVVPDVYDAVRWVLNELDKRAYPEDEVLARKLRTPDELRTVTDAGRAAGRRTVLANGCFDLLHGGHISFIEDARAAGDSLILAVNSNLAITRLKGRGRPILDEPSRLQLLAALQAVDYLTVFHEDSADELLEELRPDIHAKGTDYRDDNVPELQTSRRLGIRTVIAGAAKENSTRDIIEVVLERARAGLR
ncbi:HAD-IIIA family hydrolase [Candidatus Poribacteria bacterium]|nr:HAD-IIIA family hydrolase [Candidatus Poribacteria bacterium]